MMTRATPAGSELGRDDQGHTHTKIQSGREARSNSVGARASLTQRMHGYRGQLKHETTT